MFQDLTKTGQAIVDQIIQLVYFMRGSLQYHAAYSLSPFERQAMFNFIEERIESESKKMMPIY